MIVAVSRWFAVGAACLLLTAVPDRDVRADDQAGQKTAAAPLTPPSGWPDDVDYASGTYPVIDTPPSQHRREVGPRDYGLGMRAPNYQVADVNGRHVSLNHWRGNVVVLDLWMTSCGPCLRGMPQLSELARSYQGKNVVFVTVCCYGGPDAAAFKQDALQFAEPWLPFYIDLQTNEKQDVCAALHNQTGKPTQIIFSRSGKMIGLIVGEDDSGYPFATLRRSVDLALTTSAGS